MSETILTLISFNFTLSHDKVILLTKKKSKKENNYFVQFIGCAMQSWFYTFYRALISKILYSTGANRRSFYPSPKRKLISELWYYVALAISRVKKKWRSRRGNFRYIDYDCNFMYASTSTLSDKRIVPKTICGERPRQRQRQFQGSASFLSRFSDGCRFRKAVEKPLEARTENSSQWRTVLSSLHAHCNVYRMPARRRSCRANWKSVWSFLKISTLDTRSVIIISSALIIF